MHAELRYIVIDIYNCDNNCNRSGKGTQIQVNKLYSKIKDFSPHQHKKNNKYTKTNKQTNVYV